jgi:hypothetical protein
MKKLRSDSTFSRLKPEQRRSLETPIFDDSLVYKETQARVLVEFGLECPIPSLERFHQRLRRGKCDGVVTGCNGKCYGLNLGKLLRINMCDGVTAWGGVLRVQKAECRMFSNRLLPGHAVRNDSPIFAYVRLTGKNRGPVVKPLNPPGGAGGGVTVPTPSILEVSEGLLLKKRFSAKRTQFSQMACATTI